MTRRTVARSAGDAVAGPRWVRLDTDYFTNPKAVAAGKDGRALHVASICWVGQQLTDGHIPEASLRTLRSLAGVDRRALDRVVDAGLWLPNGTGFELHDFVAMNGTRADVEREREQWRLRQQRHRGSDGRFLGHA